MARTLKRTYQVSSKYNPKRRKVAPVRRRRSYNASIPRLALRLFETKKKETRWGEVSLNSLAGWFTQAEAMRLPQDDTYSGLEGHIIRGRGFSIKGWFKNNSNTTMLVRFGVMLVKQGSSSFSTFQGGSNILEGDSGNANITTTDSIARMTQRFNADQYRSIKQYQIKLGGSSTSDGTDVKQFKMWIPLNGQVFRYDGPNTLPTRNVYSFFALNILGNNDEILGETVECSGTTTFYYVDP